MLYGREAELRVVADLIGGLARGAGGALIVSGEAGIGKSALLAAAAELATASGARVLSATGVEAEARLPFAGLHQLLRPLLPLAERLPARQRAALLSAFGMADPEPSAAFLIGLATLELISDAAATAPVLVLADDVQWLDEPSRAVLAFVARRLAEEPAAALLAIREGVAGTSGSPRTTDSVGTTGVGGTTIGGADTAIGAHTRIGADTTDGGSTPEGTGTGTGTGSGVGTGVRTTDGGGPDGGADPFGGAGLPRLRLTPLAGRAAAALLDARSPGLDPALRDRLLSVAAGNPLALVELPKSVPAWSSDGRPLRPGVPGSPPPGSPLPESPLPESPLPGVPGSPPPQSALAESSLGGSPLPDSPVPLTARLERAFAAQGSALPDDARILLLVAAADDDGALPELLAAASAVAGTEVTADALAQVVAAGLAEIGESGLRFRHPLVRSAVYQGASVSSRRAAHTALAALLDGQPDRQAWHRAAAVLGPDEQVAADLEAAAFRAARRGATTMAVDALRRAAQASEDTPSRARRLLLAADVAFGAGHPDAGHTLLRAAESLDLTADQRTAAAWFREAYGGGWSGAAAIESFVGRAERMRAAGQPDAAISALTNIAMRCYWGNPAPSTRSAVITAAERLPVAEADPALLLVLASADPVRCGARVNAALANLPPDHADPAGMNLAGIAAGSAWAWDRSLPLLDVAVHGLRSQGRLGLLVQGLTTRAWAGVHLARPPVVLAAADEAARLAGETGQGHWVHAARLARSVVAAAAGDDNAAEAMIRQAEAGYLAMGALPMLSLVQFARGRAAMLNQRYPEALAQLRRVLDPADAAYHPYVGTWGLADLVEAAVHGGDLDTGRAFLDQLESLAAATTGPLLLAGAAYARPLLAAADGGAAANGAAANNPAANSAAANGGPANNPAANSAAANAAAANGGLANCAAANGAADVEALYLAALMEGLAGWPGYRARLLLSYGGWLRRQRRAAEARTPLREARDAFDALEFAQLADQARMELRAAGESSSRREPRPWDQLTAQELQIAQLAADGLSNREIGDQLYISHRTVSAHLYRIFPKLGITSRSQLHAAIS